MQLKTPIAKWQVHQYFTDRLVIVAATREDVFRLIDRLYSTLDEHGLIVETNAVVEKSHVAPSDIIWVKAEVGDWNEVGDKIPGLEDADPAVITQPKRILVVRMDGLVRDFREMDLPWSARDHSIPYELEPLEELEWWEPHWDSGGHTHNWRTYIDENVQRLWSTFNVEQRYNLYKSADTNASREDWE